MPYLVGLTGPYTDQAFEVKDGRTTIGRGPACNLILAQDAAVSRAHAILVVSGSVVQVQDAGSLHGVWVNGKRTAQAHLRLGDCVQVGASVFQLLPVPAPPDPPIRLKVILPPATGAPGARGAPDRPLPLAVGCLYYLAALLFPIPFGFIAAFTCRAKPHPADRQLGTACLIVSILSTMLQIGISVLLVQSLLSRSYFF